MQRLPAEILTRIVAELDTRDRISLFLVKSKQCQQAVQRVGLDELRFNCTCFQCRDRAAYWDPGQALLLGVLSRTKAGRQLILGTRLTHRDFHHTGSDSSFRDHGILRCPTRPECLIIEAPGSGGTPDIVKKWLSNLQADRLRKLDFGHGHHEWLSSILQLTSDTLECITINQVWYFPQASRAVTLPKLPNVRTASFTRDCQDEDVIFAVPNVELAVCRAAEGLIHLSIDGYQPKFTTQLVSTVGHSLSFLHVDMWDNRYSRHLTQLETLSFRCLNGDDGRPPRLPPKVETLLPHTCVITPREHNWSQNRVDYAGLKVIKWKLPSKLDGHDFSQHIASLLACCERHGIALQDHEGNPVNVQSYQQAHSDYEAERAARLAWRN